jgi:hypothetical protein
MSHTPTPWGLEDIDGESNYQHHKAYALVDGRGKTIMDSLNSEVSMIECDPDFDGSHSWDEQARQDFEFAKLACNSHDSLVAALSALYEDTKSYIEVNHLGDVHHNQAMQLAREALASIKGAR